MNACRPYRRTLVATPFLPGSLSDSWPAHPDHDSRGISLTGHTHAIVKDSVRVFCVVVKKSIAAAAAEKESARLVQL